MSQVVVRFFYSFYFLYYFLSYALNLVYLPSLFDNNKNHTVYSGRSLHFQGKSWSCNTNMAMIVLIVIRDPVLPAACTVDIYSLFPLFLTDIKMRIKKSQYCFAKPFLPHFFLLAILPHKPDVLPLP